MKNTANCHQIAIRIEKQNPKLSLSTDTEWNCSGQFTSRFHIHPNIVLRQLHRSKMKMNLN